MALYVQIVVSLSFSSTTDVSFFFFCCCFSGEVTEEETVMVAVAAPADVEAWRQEEEEAWQPED